MKFPTFVRGYITYGIPLLVVVIYLKGYWDMFAPKARAEGNPMLLIGWMAVAVLFLALASFINIGLDLITILVFHMGVEGPAIATVVSQGLSGIICLFYMKKKFPILRISREEWKPKKFYLYRLCYMGIPMGLQYSVTAVGNLVVGCGTRSCADSLSPFSSWRWPFWGDGSFPCCFWISRMSR